MMCRDSLGPCPLRTHIQTLLDSSDPTLLTDSLQRVLAAQPYAASLLGPRCSCGQSAEFLSWSALHLQAVLAGCVSAHPGQSSGCACGRALCRWLSFCVDPGVLPGAIQFFALYVWLKVQTPFFHQMSLCWHGYMCVCRQPHTVLQETSCRQGNINNTVAGLFKRNSESQSEMKWLMDCCEMCYDECFVKSDMEERNIKIWRNPRRRRQEKEREDVKRTPKQNGKKMKMMERVKSKLK